MSLRSGRKLAWKLSWGLCDEIGRYCRIIVINIKVSVSCPGSLSKQEFMRVFLLNIKLALESLYYADGRAKQRRSRSQSEPV